jgi:hypothetical protein
MKNVENARYKKNAKDVKKEVAEEEYAEKEDDEKENVKEENVMILSKFDDDCIKAEFSLDSLLAMHESKKIKNKDRSAESLNKDKSIRRDSSDFEYVETEFSQRVDENVDVNVNQTRDRNKERSKKRIETRKSQKSVKESKTRAETRAEHTSERRDREQKDREREDREREIREDRERDRDQSVYETTVDIARVSSKMTSLLQFN